MLLGIAGVASAQSSANQTVTINGTVIQAITLSVSTSTLSLGNMVAGTPPPSISATTSPVMFTLTGNGSSVVSVTFSPVTLSGPSSSSLTFTPTVVGDSVSANQASASPISTGATVTLSGSNYSSANYYFWLGGSVASLPSAQTPGAYTGTFTLQVTYN